MRSHVLVAYILHPQLRHNTHFDRSITNDIVFKWNASHVFLSFRQPDMSLLTIVPSTHRTTGVNSETVLESLHRAGKRGVLVPVRAV